MVIVWLAENCHFNCSMLRQQNNPNSWDGSSHALLRITERAHITGPIGTLSQLPPDVLTVPPAAFQTRILQFTHMSPVFAVRAWHETELLSRDTDGSFWTHGTYKILISWHGRDIRDAAAAGFVLAKAIITGKNQLWVLSNMSTSIFTPQLKFLLGGNNEDGMFRLASQQLYFLKYIYKKSLSKELEEFWKQLVDILKWNISGNKHGNMLLIS